MVGDNIKKFRKANNMSQDELAEKLDVTRQSVSLWETGQTQPSLDNIVALSKLFNISTNDLLLFEKGAPAVATNLYAYFKNFVVTKGILKGDRSYYTKSADNYGGSAADDFTLYYWGDTDTVEFCLHRVLDSVYSINYYLRIAKIYMGNYEYISSYYYRGDGNPVYEARGSITAAEFTTAYPLLCSKYSGSSDYQDEFMEISRKGICDTLSCLKNFLSAEGCEYSFTDMAFTNF